MEVLLFVLFFISALIFFISGKDDFGRTESKLILKEEKTAKDDEKKEIKVEEKEDIEHKEETAKDRNRLKVAEKGKIENQEDVKND